MKKIKNWLIVRILPIWAREEFQKEIARLKAQIQEQEAHIRELNACIDGMQYCIRHQQRIEINRKE